MAINEAVVKERAGWKMYQETLKQFQSRREGAEVMVVRHACKFANEQNPEDRAAYLVEKARFEAWDEAIDLLTRNAGDWMRLDFPKET